VGLLLTVTLVAVEALAVATVMPEVRADLGGYDLYGWVFSGFFLASLVGIVVGGTAADRRGLAVPFLGGLVLFAAGLVTAGLAASMEVLVVGRILQGVGAGAVPAASYTAIARAFQPAERPRMFALLSTAWVVPGLVGPAAAAAVEHALSWRWVFLGILPLVVVAAVLTAGALARVPPGAAPPAGEVGRAASRRLARVGVLVVAVGAVQVAATGVTVMVAVVLAGAGLPLAVWAFTGLVPPGTLRLAPGIPATVAVRGLLTWSFFQADAYVSLAVVDGRGSSTFLAGAALSAASVLWAAGSWVQARRIDDLGPRRLVAIGFTIIIGAVALSAAVAIGLPVGLMVLAWGVGGFGMGLAYSPLSVVVLAAARPGEEGASSAALQLSDVLGIAVGTGLGGGVVAVADSRGWEVSSGVAVVFALATAVGLVGLAASRRIPASLHVR
jgi:MFS family permease